MGLQDFSRVSEEDFTEAFSSSTVAEFVAMLQEEGITLRPGNRSKLETIKAGYAKIQERIGGTAPDPVPPAGVSPPPPAPAGSAHFTHKVRSRQPMGRHRDGRFFPHAWTPVREDELTERQRADDVLEIREIG